MADDPKDGTSPVALLKSEDVGPRDTVPLVGELDKEEKDRLYQKLGIYEKGYTFGVLNFGLNLVILGRFPQFFWVWHLTKGFVYLPWRFCRFYRKNWEWYMMDFCYFVTYMTVIGCALAFIRITTGYESFFAKYNYTAMRVAFGFTNGALLMAVPMFGNKIVFHDVDNTTSLYIHLSPALTAWTLRWGGGYGTSLIEEWWPGMFHVCNDMIEADASVKDWRSALWYTGPCQGNLQEFFVGTLIGWVVIWGIPYYVVMFCCLKGYFERHPEKAFLFRDSVKDTKGMFRYLQHMPECSRPLGFMSGHLIWTLVAGCVSILMWNSFVLHSLFLSSIFMYALHNGSTYMFRVVATRNMQKAISRAVSESPKGLEKYQAVASDAEDTGKTVPTVDP